MVITAQLPTLYCSTFSVPFLSKSVTASLDHLQDLTSDWAHNVQWSVIIWKCRGL